LHQYSDHPGGLDFSRNSRSLPKFSPPSLDDNSSTINKGNTEGRICCRVLAVILAQSTWSFSKGVGAVGKILGDVGKFLKGMEEASEFLP